LAKPRSFLSFTIKSSQHFIFLSSSSSSESSDSSVDDKMPYEAPVLGIVVRIRVPSQTIWESTGIENTNIE